MSVELKILYQEIYSDFDVRLMTNSCFNKKIDWFHVIENQEFIKLLHGGELIFNTSIATLSEKEQIEFINCLYTMNAQGLIVSFPDNHNFSKMVIDHCNHLEFPLFLASWETSYSKIMRCFSEILLNHERNETNLIAALKNAIYDPENEQLYLNHFERNGFYQDSSYTIVIIGLSQQKKTPFDCTFSISQLEKSLHYLFKPSIIYAEKEFLVLMTNEISQEELCNTLTTFCHANPCIQIGIGQEVHQISNLHFSYRNALFAFQLCTRISSENPLCYNNLGVYQILANVKDSNILYPTFVQNTLGRLIAYDSENNTSYMKVLRDYFDNNCSIIQTAEATFFHQNTLKYKIKNIKDILGYDITLNENRLKIMLSLSILKMQEIYPFE